jgi:hypothetical protein
MQRTKKNIATVTIIKTRAVVYLILKFITG